MTFVTYLWTHLTEVTNRCQALFKEFPNFSNDGQIRDEYAELRNYDGPMGRQKGRDEVTIRNAQIYADWVLDQMRIRCLTPAQLGRYSELGKQAITTITNGRGYQPSAKQMVGLAKAFRMQPNDVLAGIGLWQQEGTGQVAPEIAEAYRDLDDLGRRYLVRVGLALKEEFAASSEVGRPPSLEELKQQNLKTAAITEPDTARDAKRQSEFHEL